jgi:hydroxymethylglutaryl-CoA synthase
MSAGMNLGISGMSAYVPPYRVSLKDWCSWTSSSWDKTRSVVGTGFRMPGPLDSVYTMAANAALKLILDHDVDPQRVGFLAVGTESGTDNATSAAVVVRGMLDQALAARGLPTLSRQIEAPEFKQACLGGLYGLKGGLRYLGLDGAGRQALVVAADVAEYAQNSSGEPTQGAGAVAMLLEESPKLLEVDLRSSASASAYRALDFRKPFARYCGQDLGADGRPRDFPVFNGKYSTACYTDATLASLGPRDRDVLRLRFYEDRPRERCAAELGLRVETFDVALYRALRRFEAAWRARGETTTTTGAAPPAFGR